MMRLLVTGYGGFVAGSVVWQAPAPWQVTAVSRGPVPGSPARVDHRQVDLRDTATLRQLLQQANPHVIVHAAAMSQIDRCQLHREEAHAVNVDVTEQISRWCGETQTRLVFCSTDSVFDGTRGMYGEEDSPVAVNYYAETKVAAEQIVRQHCRDHVIARLALVTGLPLIGQGNAFVANMQKSFARGETVTMPANEIRTPIDVVTLGRALLELAASPFAGTIHLAGQTRLNRYEMGLAIADRLGYPRTLVASTNSNQLPDRARRPNDASLDNRLARSQLQTTMLSFSDGLELALAMAEQVAHE